MNEPAADTSHAITRTRLEAVIRRAAELYAAEADAEDGISEAELIRIAAELGLPSRFVRQALYEIPATTMQPSLLDRLSAPARLSIARVVPGEPDPTYRRLEEYLVTREYLQVTRRQTGRAWFSPADDLVSRIVRSITRPSSRHLLTRARGVSLTVHPLEEGKTHLRLDLDLASLRKELLLLGGIIGGGPVGLTLGGIGAAAVDALAGPIGAAGILATVGGAIVTATGAGLAIAAGSFRRVRLRARAEVDCLLDRVESGDRLDPPLPPWRRRLRQHLLGPPAR